MSSPNKKCRLPRLESEIPVPISKEVLKDVVSKAKDWALMHGACMRSKNSYNPDILQFAPFLLLPSPFPRSEFNKAVKIQPILNELMHYVAHDNEFLRSALKTTIQVDDFTKRLFQIFETVQKEGVTQPVSLGLIRSDLMLETHCSHEVQCNGNCYCCWKQVEINTIASGFGWLGPVSAAIQRYILQELGYNDKLKNLPPNDALSGLCSGMIEAWKIYGKKKSVVLFIVEDVTYNICDQRFHEFEIRKVQPDLLVIRKSLSQLINDASLGPNKELLIDGHEVAVIYFRAGYEPGHYHTEKEWDVRLLMERSRAIKCPSIHYHLAGTKKVQQALARSNVLEKFLKDQNKVEMVNEIFTGLYSLDFDEYGDKAIELGIKDPDRFVLKPQREGGGNNVYGLEVRDALNKMKNSNERTAWILMERINPPIISNYIVRPGGPDCPELVDVVSELGIFGVIIGDSNKILVNKEVGHMLRTKLSTANEGGVAAGLGALDSPYLIN